MKAILESMRWLGLDWDEGPEAGGSYGPYFQSDRRAQYREAVESLLKAGKAYRCYCTKDDLDQARAALKAQNPKAQFTYPGTCRDRKDEPDLPHVIRFKSPRDGAVSFDDKVFGKITTPNKELQDFVIMRSDGFPLYNLGAVVDDHLMDITLVARGRDHIGNTPLQILLYEAFGWKPPEFAHLPMMLSPKGEKLSKRHAAVGVQDYRDRGYSPMGVINYLVRFGWSYGDQEIFSRSDLLRLFDWSRVSKSDGKFDEKKFLDVNFEHLKQEHLTSADDYATELEPFLATRGLGPTKQHVVACLPTIRERARTFVEAAHALDFFFREPPELEPAARQKFLVPAAASHLERAAKLFRETRDFKATTLEESLRNWTDAEQIKMKDVAQPLRVAVTGRAASPPLFDVLELLGRERSIERIVQAARLAAKQA